MTAVGAISWGKKKCEQTRGIILRFLSQSKRKGYDAFFDLSPISVLKTFFFKKKKLVRFC